MDEFEVTLVNFNKLSHKSNPFILASQAKKVFHVQDQLNLKWSIDLLPLQKDFVENEDVDDLTNDCMEYHPYVNPLPNVKTFDEMDEFRFTLVDFNKLGYKSDHFILVFVFCGKKRC